MGWAKFDDRWPTHPKLLAAGLEAKGLDACGICYAAGQETDGFIPDSALSILAAGHRNPHKVAKVLVDVGRWTRDDERKGYVIHDYLDYNPSKESREAERQGKRDAGRRGGLKSRPGGSKAKAGASTLLQAEPKHPVEPDTNHAGEAPSRPVPYPPQVPLEPPTSLALVGNPEKEKSGITTTETEPLAKHLAGLFPDRQRMRDECADVVHRCLQVADRSVVDEAIGAMYAVEDRPRSPKYLLTTVRNRLVSMGAYAASDPALEILGAA